MIKRHALLVNKETLHRQFVEHPYPDSLMAITDILRKYNITTTSYTIKDAKLLANCDEPNIALVYINSEPYFSIIDSATRERVIWYNPIKHKKENISFDDFKRIYGGVIAFVEVKNYIAEAGYKEKKKEFFVKRVVETIPVIALIIAFLAVFLSLLLSNNSSIHLGLYVVGLGIGSVICAVLLDFEINDNKSSIVERLCPVGKKWDCTAVLRSSANNIYGINWSTIGLAYFAGTLITLACVGTTNLDYYRMSACLNVFTLPFIIYSLYYQTVVSNHWCVMCLSVLVLLICLFVVSIYGGFFSLSLNVIISCIPFVIIDLIILWGSNMYISQCIQNNAYNKLFPSFNKLRYKENVFHALLEESPFIESVPFNMSINLGKPTASVKILKVCDPFCGACSKSHLKMEELLEEKDIFLQVIFTVFSKDNKTKMDVIKMLYALKEKHGDQYMTQVLHDWYSQEEKNYEEFRKKYAIDDKSMEMQEDKVKWLEQKTLDLEIHYTPTFYINNHQIPDDFYSYNDFGHLFES